MKTKSLLTLFAVICAASISAQTSNYAGSEAAKHVGETATVTDKVDGVHQSGKGNIFLNMGGKYPNQVFTALSQVRAPLSSLIRSNTRGGPLPRLERSPCTMASRKSSLPLSQMGSH